jgi:hypothetical protein
LGISREHLFKSLGVVKEGPQLTAWTKRAYDELEEYKWRNESYLTTSFHSSSYPGLEKSCDRQALYKLMNFPQPEPISAKGIGIMEVGKAVEEQIVRRWHELGIVLGPAWPEQMKIEDEDLWLSGYIDAPLNLLPEWPFVLPVEIKSKKNSVIEYMKVGGQSYDLQHYMQLQSYIFYCIKNHEKMGWDKLGLEKSIGGIILYVSREDPSNTHEFYVNVDYEAINSANQKLADWKEFYFDDTLPARNKEWKWTEQPCQWCPFKKHICKPDHQAGIVNLSQSNGVQFAKAHNPNYNADNIRRRVLERWNQVQMTLW